MGLVAQTSGHVAGGLVFGGQDSSACGDGEQDVLMVPLFGGVTSKHGRASGSSWPHRSGQSA